MFTKESAPAEVRNLTHLFCQCKDSNCEDGKTCTCIQAGLKCIEVCVCENCPNIQTVSLEIEDYGVTVILAYRLEKIALKCQPLTVVKTRKRPLSNIIT